MGVRLVNLAPGQSLVAIARNEESLDGTNGGPAGGGGGDEAPADADDVSSADSGAPGG